MSLGAMDGGRGVTAERDGRAGSPLPAEDAVTVGSRVSRDAHRKEILI